MKTEVNGFDLDRPQASHGCFQLGPCGTEQVNWRWQVRSRGQRRGGGSGPGQREQRAAGEWHRFIVWNKGRYPHSLAIKVVELKCSYDLVYINK